MFVDVSFSVPEQTSVPRRPAPIIVSDSTLNQAQIAANDDRFTDNSNLSKSRLGGSAAGDLSAADYDELSMLCRKLLVEQDSLKAQVERQALVIQVMKLVKVFNSN